MGRYLTRKKPGYMLRACIAWFIWNGVLLFTLGILLYMLSHYLQQLLTAWYIMVPIIVAVIVSEWVIMAETIAPIIKDWIKQEESVEGDEKFSWEKK